MPSFPQSSSGRPVCFLNLLHVALDKGSGCGSQSCLLSDQIFYHSGKMVGHSLVRAGDFFRELSVRDKVGCCGHDRSSGLSYRVWGICTLVSKSELAVNPNFRSLKAASVASLSKLFFLLANSRLKDVSLVYR